MVGLLAPESLGSVMSTTLNWVIRNFGWGFVLMAFGALAFSLFLVVHPWGSIRLGPDDSRPEFGTFSWVSMMFATGMGIGLIFWGVAEPLTHLNTPPMGMAEPGTPSEERLTLLASWAATGELTNAAVSVHGLAQRLRRLQRRELVVALVDRLQLEPLLQSGEVEVVLLVELRDEAVGVVAVALELGGCGRGARHRP